MAARAREDPINLANAITAFRILIVPPILYLLEADWGAPGPSGDWGKLLCLVLVFVAGLSDYYDGVIARRLRTETKLGRFLDPIADKFLVCSVLLVLVAMGRLAAWVLIVELWREFAVLGLRMHLSAEGIVLGASRWAKYKTVFHVAALVCVLIVLDLEVLAASGSLAVPWSSYVFYAHVADAAVLVSLLFSVVSGLEYFGHHWDSLGR